MADTGSGLPFTLHDLLASGAWTQDALAVLLEGINECVWIIDADRRVLFANRAANELIGNQDGLLPEVLGCAQDGETVQLGGVDGMTHPLAVGVRTLPNGDHRGNHVIIARDLAEAKRNRDQTLLFRRAIEASSDGMILVDARMPVNPIVYVNPAFESITGYNAREVIGQNCRFLNRGDSDQTGIADLRAAIQSRQRCEVVIRNYRKDGRLFYNRLIVSPMRGDDGEVSHFIGIMTDITEERKRQENLQWRTTHDPLTGLPHYSAMIEQYQRMLLRARAGKQHLAVLFVDIDAFHTINDSMDFAAGDQALRALAERLADAVGSEALVTRHAGDKFVIAILHSGGEVLIARAQAVCDRMAEPLPIGDPGVLHLTASIGISSSDRQDVNAAELTRQAEFAMQRAKRRGRNGIAIFDQTLERYHADRVNIGRRMREGLELGQFVLHYQPQVNAHDGQVTAFEALVRWNSPELGPLAPMRFINVAEANGLILPLGRALLRDACRQLATWRAPDMRELTLSLNVSPVQLLRPDFVAEVRTLISDTGIDAQRLEFELTESVLMDNIDEAVTHMRALRALGVKFALDDFGVGHSSLSYLQRLPIDKLKIDQRFVATVTQDGTSATLVRTMISVAHHLGLRVTAEGVETEAQYAYLRRADCDLLQGHHFSPAVPANELAALLKRLNTSPPSAHAEPTTRTLLILDDEDNIRRALCRLFRRDGYRVLDAANAERAFELLATHEVQVILSDQRMPEMNGTEFLSRVKELYPRTVRMVLSGFTELNAVTEAINRGAIYKFLTKPWDDEELRRSVLDAFRRYEGH